MPKVPPRKPRIELTAQWLWLLMLFLFALWLTSHHLAQPGVEEVSYSEFKQMVRTGRLSEVTLAPTQVEGRSTSVQGQPSKVYRAVRVEDPDLIKDLDARNIPYRGKLESQWAPYLLSWVIPLLILILIWRWFLRRMGGAQQGLLAIGQSKARVYIDRDTGVTFDDVAGVDEAKEELNLETSVDRSLARVRPHGGWRLCLRGARPLGGAATRPIARFSRRLAALLLLAGPAPPRRRALPDNAKTAHSGASN